MDQLIAAMLMGIAGAIVQQPIYPPPPPMVMTPRQMNPQIRQPDGTERSEVVNHNGSIMTLTVWPDFWIQINYAQPREALIPYGVRPGTLLVYGKWNEDKTFNGVAHAFYCGALPYQVAGKVDRDSQALILEGPAPRVYAGTCQVADYVWTANSYLRFDRMPEGEISCSLSR